jgi:hypothetical protein
VYSNKARESLAKQHTLVEMVFHESIATRVKMRNKSKNHSVSNRVVKESTIESDEMEVIEKTIHRELISDIFPVKVIHQSVNEGVASLGEIEEHDSENEFSTFPIKQGRPPS